MSWGWQQDQSAGSSHALSGGLSDEGEDKYLEEVIHEYVKAELDKAIADSAIRREVDYVRQQHELLRRDFDDYRGPRGKPEGAYSSAPGVGAPPAANDTGLPGLQKLQKEFGVLQIALEEWQLKDQTEFAELQMKLEEWQVKARLSFLAVGMLAVQATKLAEAEREAVLTSLEKEEKNLTTGLRQFPAANAEYQSAFKGSGRGAVPLVVPFAGNQSPSLSNSELNQLGHEARNSPSPNSDWWKSKWFSEI